MNQNLSSFQLWNVLLKIPSNKWLKWFDMKTIDIISSKHLQDIKKKRKNNKAPQKRGRTKVSNCTRN